MRKEPTNFVVWSRMMKLRLKAAKRGFLFWDSLKLGTYVRSGKK